MRTRGQFVAGLLTSFKDLWSLSKWDALFEQIMRSSLPRRWPAADEFWASFSSHAKKNTKNPMNREKYLYPRFPRGWSRDECRIGHALLLALWTFFCDNSFFAVGNDFQFLYLYIWLIRVDNSSCGHCWAISSSLKWDAFFRSTNNVTLPDLPSKKWFHLLGYLFVRHVRTNNLLNGLFILHLAMTFSTHTARIVSRQPSCRAL